MFDDTLLQEYMANFYGYGNYGGRYWFVGMEEGGGKTVEECVRRIEKWAAGGREELIDLAGGYHYETASDESPAPRYFARYPRLQTTWNKLIRILLAAEGQSITLDAIRAYQRDKLGRPDSDNCLLELLPLPSPSTRHWFYGDHSEIGSLRSREEYKGKYAPKRAKHLQARIGEHAPAVVIFYSVDWWYRQWWELIAGRVLTPYQAGSDAFFMGSDERTLFAIVKHPASKGISNDYFHEVGGAIGSRLGAGRRH